MFGLLGQHTAREYYGKASVRLISQFSHFKEKRIETGLTEIRAVTSLTSQTDMHTQVYKDRKVCARTHTRIKIETCIHTHSQIHTE